MSTSIRAKIRVRFEAIRVSPFDTLWTVPRAVADDRPAHPDLFDLALDGAELDPVALVVRTLEDDEDAHQVVEDDALAGQRDGERDETEPGDHGQQVEDGQDDEERDGHDEDLEDRREQVLDGRDALDALLGHELGDLGVRRRSVGLLAPPARRGRG